jgi:hypothetical protein
VENFAAASRMYREMGVGFWAERAEAEVKAPG